MCELSRRVREHCVNSAIACQQCVISAKVCVNYVKVCHSL